MVKPMEVRVHTRIRHLNWATAGLRCATVLARLRMKSAAQALARRSVELVRADYRVGEHGDWMELVMPELDVEFG